MKICDCGLVLPDEAQVCSRCGGTTLESFVLNASCPLQLDKKHCKNCMFGKEGSCTCSFPDV